MSSLKKLTISNCKLVPNTLTFNPFKKEHFINLTRLDVSNTGLQEGKRACLTNLTEGTKMLMNALSGSSALTNLNICANLIRNEGFMLLLGTDLPSLEELNIANNDIEFVDNELIERTIDTLKKLKAFEVSRNRGSTDALQKLDNAFGSRLHSRRKDLILRPAIKYPLQTVFSL